jgi:hypothetical protein
VAAASDLNRDDLDDQSVERVESRFRFDSRAAAEDFLAGQLVTTTTSTTTTTTTTTTVPATTTPPTSPPATPAP